MADTGKVYCEWEPGTFDETQFGPGPEPRRHLGPESARFDEVHVHLTNGLSVGGPGPIGEGVVAPGSGPVGTSWQAIE